MNLINTNSENSEYTNYTANNRNCYLVFSNSFGHNEDCAYGTCLQSSKDCIDSVHITQCELCVGCLDCIEGFRLVGCQDCVRCSDSFWCVDCRNCTNCFASIGLRNKEYYFNNQPLSKEEYEAKIHALNLHTWSGFSNAFAQADSFLQKMPRLYSRQYNAENCTGDYIFNGKNCVYAFDTSDSEDVRHTQFCVKGEHDSMDCAYFGGGELNYEGLSIVEGYNCMFTNIAWWNVARLRYCELCFHSQDAFGCIGLKRNQYCILNKQYSKEKYEELVPRIIAQMKGKNTTVPESEDGLPAVARLSEGWGEFFPVELSPFTYNETLAQEYFPMAKEQALAEGLAWRDPEPVPDTPTHSIPESITECICKETVLKCEESSKPFRVIPMELEVYKKLNIAIPRFSPDVRREHILRKRNPRILNERLCDNCQKVMQSSYPPDSSYQVWCEECYRSCIN